VNQDTGEIANPDNIQTDLPGNPAKAKYGPAVTGVGEPPLPSSAAPPPAKAVPVRVGEPLGAFESPDATEFDEEGTEPAAFETRKLGPLDQGQKEANAELEHPKSTKAEKAAAEAQLGQVAAVEYGRPDGGREPIKRALARAGYANPQRKE
jgi:hypothetical protein